MNLRTGDILVWRSTNLYDILSDHTIMINSLHAGIVLVGDKLSEFSICGKSPSNTYATFLVDQVLPVEEVIGHVWYRPNGSALYHIRRKNGKNISSDETYNVCKEYFSLDKLSFLHSVYIAVAAYFRMAGVAPSTGYDNKRWNVCSLLIAYFLDRFGLLHDDAVPNNLLPLDFYDLRFYQKDPYERIEIFNKNTHTYQWLFTAMFIRLGQIKPEPISNPIVDKMLAGYDYPRKIKATPEIKNKANGYLDEHS